jgi:hypothetical protein
MAMVVHGSCCRAQRSLSRPLLLLLLLVMVLLCWCLRLCVVPLGKSWAQHSCRRSCLAAAPAAANAAVSPETAACAASASGVGGMQTTASGTPSDRGGTGQLHWQPAVGWP